MKTKSQHLCCPVSVVRPTRFLTSGTTMHDPQLDNLVKILRLAYSGELAAAYAYRGHWRSVSDEPTRARIHEIEDEEWHHRRLIGEMLAQLDTKPSRIREVRAFLIGR